MLSLHVCLCLRVCACLLTQATWNLTGGIPDEALMVTNQGSWAVPVIPTWYAVHALVTFPASTPSIEP